MAPPADGVEQAFSLTAARAQPPGIFNRAAIQAALKFKYKPKMVDGKPVAVSGVRNKITFELKEE